MRVILTKETGKNIRRIMNEKGIAVRYIRDSLGIADNQIIYRWWEGKHLPTIDNLINLADALGCTIDELLVTKEA